MWRATGSRLVVAAAAATLFACLAPGVASAQAARLDGSPVDVYADGLGSMQFRFDGRAAGVFYHPGSNEGHAGLEIVEGDQYFDLGADTRESVAGPTVGPGTITSTYDVGSDLRVNETVTYVNGSRFVDIRYEISNLASGPVSFRAGELADLYVAGSDEGTGVFGDTAPRFVGGRSETGVTSGLVEVTPWAHYQESDYGAVFDNFESGGLSDTIDPALVDNGVGAEWAVNDLEPGSPKVIDVRWSLEPVVTVTTPLDTSPDTCTPTRCTLREALQDSQPGSVIIVPAGDYELAGPLEPTRDLTVQGAGPTTRIIANPSARALTVMSGSLIMSGVEITGGSSGLGGGVYVEPDAALTLTDSTVDGNTASRGGGIAADGTLTLVRSTVSGNHAETNEPGAGGGIAVGTAGVATLENVTVSGNSAFARGGGIYTQNSLSLRHVTITGNSTGIDADAGAQTVAANTLVVRNAGGNCTGNPAVPIQWTTGMSDDATCGGAGRVADAKIGPLASNGGPTKTHALLKGSPAIDAGDDEECVGTDQRGVTIHGTTCDIGAYEYVAPQSSPPPLPPPPPPKGPPPPVAHKNVNATPSQGTVKIKLPGTNTFVVLTAGKQVPLGTIVDTTKGRVKLVAASNSNGGTASATFYEGIFKVGQTKGSKPITTLTLVEKLSCARAGSANAAKKKKKKRHLWGDGKGKFRTSGSYSSATVRGTKWLVQDTCTTTLTKVVRGTVTVRDFVKKKNVTVKAGKKYVAKRKR